LEIGHVFYLTSFPLFHHPSQLPGYFTLLETVVLSLLIIKAFPAHEVTDYPLKNLEAELKLGAMGIMGTHGNSPSHIVTW
jgi:hypothetical protein